MVLEAYGQWFLYAGIIFGVVAGAMFLGKRAKLAGVSRMGFAIVALVALVLAGLSGGLAAFGIGGPAEPGPQALWDVRLSTVTHSDAGVLEFVAADGKSVAISGSEADLADNAPGDSAIVSVINILNLNTGDVDTVYSFTGRLTSYVSVSDPATGALFPLVEPEATDPGVADTDWSDTGDGIQIRDTFYDSLVTAGSNAITADVNLNDAAIAPMTLGNSYSYVIMVAGVALTHTITPTS